MTKDAPSNTAISGRLILREFLTGLYHIFINPCYFLCLETKEVTKEPSLKGELANALKNNKNCEQNSRLQSRVRGIGAPVFRLAHAIQLAPPRDARCRSNSIAFWRGFAIRAFKSARFRPLFLWFISFGGAKEMNKLLKSIHLFCSIPHNIDCHFPGHNLLHYE